MSTPRLLPLLACLLPLIACAPPPAPAYGPDEQGPALVGVRQLLLHDAARDRELAATFWYPAEAGAAPAGEPASALAHSAAQGDIYVQLLEAAPAGCPTAQTRAGRDLPPKAEAPLPLVLFSHCLNCVGTSSFSVAERLASHGFLVAAVDHTGNTLWDNLEGASTGMSVGVLDERVADQRFLLSALLDPAGPGLPAPLVGLADPARVGALGHSFGGVTVGRLLQDDPRVHAAMAMAAPVENSLLPGTEMAAIDRPILFLLAQEDNSISELGNGWIRDNFGAAVGPAWLIEVRDAGHWSFSDICALTPTLVPGCGEAQRQTDPAQTFTYLPVADGLQVAQSYAAAFFRATLDDDAEARGWLNGAQPELPVTMERWEP